MIKLTAERLNLELTGTWAQTPTLTVWEFISTTVKQKIINAKMFNFIFGRSNLLYCWFYLKYYERFEKIYRIYMKHTMGSFVKIKDNN